MKTRHIDGVNRHGVGIKIRASERKSPSYKWVVAGITAGGTLCGPIWWFATRKAAVAYVQAQPSPAHHIVGR